MATLLIAAMASVEFGAARMPSPALTRCRNAFEDLCAARDCIAQLYLSGWIQFVYIDQTPNGVLHPRLTKAVNRRQA